MFKRVDRRRKRKEIEESLGLDDDERGVFGLHDTDSSESESDASESASTSSSATSSDGPRIQSKNKQKRGAFSPSNDEDSEHVTDDEEDEEGGSEHGVTPHLTIASALDEPVRLIRPDPEAWVCAFCPGKILKHAAMVKAHEASRIHRARLNRIQELAIEFSPDENIWSVLAKSTTETQPVVDGVTLSRRAEKKKAKQVKLKERRKKTKERKVAVMAAAKTKEITKTTEKESMARRFSDREEEATRASKRIKVESSKSLGNLKNMHRTSLRTEPRKNKRTT